MNFRGKEFRKSFNKLGELTCIYPNVPHLALTATATPESLEYLCKVLQFENQHYIISNPDRANIYLEVRQRLPNIKKYEKIEQILNPIISELRQKILDFPLTVIYCDNLETIGYSYQYISSELGDLQYVNDEKIPENRIFAQYHKDYTVPMKRHILSELRKQDPTLRLVLATVALGMGLNAPSISRIIHTRPPTSLEKYLQEIGRAGRSGQAAEAIVYYNNSDIASNRKGFQPQVKEYVTSTSCLRRHLVKYFGFDTTILNASIEFEKCCSNCKNQI